MVTLNKKPYKGLVFYKCEGLYKPVSWYLHCKYIIYSYIAF